VAAVVLVAMVAFHLFDYTTAVTWAEITDPLMKAQTATLDVVTEYQGVRTEAAFMVMGQQMRCETKSPHKLPVIIVDYERLQMQYLIPEKKQAVLIDLQTFAGEVPENYLASIRNVITELENDPDARIERLPDSEIDGVPAVVFRATIGDEEMTVWAHPETLIPIRLEQISMGVTVVCTNLQFDVPLDPSMFSMDIPDGYSTVSGQLDFDDSAEKEVLEGLRIWAHILEDDQFPEDLTFATYEKMPGLKKKLKEGTLKLSEQDKVDMGLKMGPLFGFLMSLKPEQDWQYVGAGVPFGDATKPVCWYRPIGSETYRVIYGDLSIRDVPEEELPQ
jgi:outer membrane lipoprotein-sorting protein